MSATAVEDPVGAAPPREWWQVWAQRRAQWWSARPVLAARWARVRAVGLWVALVWVLGLVVFVPELRLGVRAYLGCVWVVVAWYFLGRTKTLTWAGYLRFFSACLGWSVAIGFVSMWLAERVLDLWVIQDGPAVMIASGTEETLKLLPLAVVALLAPRRAGRFAVVDWLLLGLASGTAFLLVEESLRRVALSTGKAGIFMGVSTSRVPDEFVQFGGRLLPGPLVSDVEGWGGHGVVTAIVAAWVGLAIVAVRAVRGRGGWAVRGVRFAAVALPVLALLVTIADHAATNGGNSSVRTEDGTPKWLDPGTTNVPWWIRVAWSLFGHGHGRPAVLVVVLVAALVVDGGRLARVPGAGLLVGAPPAWVHAPAAWLRGAASAWPGVVRASAVAVARHATGAVWVVGRDLHLAAVAFIPAPGQSRRAAAIQGATALSAQRAARELGYESLAHPFNPRRYRLGAGIASAGLLTGALVLAPLAASRLDRVYERMFWLAGVLQRVGNWWHDQPLATQILIGLGVAALVTLSGGSLALAFGISGVLTWGLDKSHGIATWVRDPQQATRDYLLTATPAQIAADTLGVALTFAPANFAGAAIGRGVRTVAKDVADDPAAWLARQRALIREAPDAGEVQIATLVGHGGIDDAAEAARAAISRVFSSFPHGADDVVKAAWYRRAATAEGLPPHMRQVMNGKAFHHEVYGHFEAREVTIHRIDEASGGVERAFRVDALSQREVVSLKETQLTEVQASTVERYIDEIVNKYNPRRPELVVAATAGNEAKLGTAALGRPLRGRMTLGVPIQHTRIPQGLVDYARAAGVRIKQLAPYGR